MFQRKRMVARLLFALSSWIFFSEPKKREESGCKVFLANRYRPRGGQKNVGAEPGIPTGGFTFGQPG